jgi:hypothetical protein
MTVPRQSNRLPRARCPVCGGSVALRRGQLLREHPDHRHPLYGVGGAVRGGKVPLCMASGFYVGDQPQLLEAVGP